MTDFYDFETSSEEPTREEIMFYFSRSQYYDPSSIKNPEEEGIGYSVLIFDDRKDEPKQYCICRQRHLIDQSRLSKEEPIELFYVHRVEQQFTEGQNRPIWRIFPIPTLGDLIRIKLRKAVHLLHQSLSDIQDHITRDGTTIKWNFEGKKPKLPPLNETTTDLIERLLPAMCEWEQK